MSLQTENQATPEGSTAGGGDFQENSTDRIRDTVTQAYSSVRPAIEQAREKVSRFGQQFKDRSSEITRNVDEQVHRSPWAYIGAIGVTGLLLGYILGRRS